MWSSNAIIPQHGCYDPNHFLPKNFVAPLIPNDALTITPRVYLYQSGVIARAAKPLSTYSTVNGKKQSNNGMLKSIVKYSSSKILYYL